MGIMPSSFDIVTESPASVEQIHAAYRRKDYWLARIEPGPALTTLDSLIVEDDGTVKVHFTRVVSYCLGQWANSFPPNCK